MDKKMRKQIMWMYAILLKSPLITIIIKTPMAFSSKRFRIQHLLHLLASDSRAGKSLARLPRLEARHSALAKKCRCHCIALLHPQPLPFAPPPRHCTCSAFRLFPSSSVTLRSEESSGSM
ncbi:hypothetical protein BDW69DRAFT_154479 [Aspergillus filifer]